MKKLKKITLVVLCLLPVTMFTYYMTFSLERISLFDFKEKQSNSMSFLKSGIDSSGQYTFSYPSEISTKYIQAYQWPPKVVTVDQTSFCDDVKNITEKMKTEKRIIAGYDFCVTSVSKVLEDKIINLYAYSLNFENKSFILYFGTKHDNCEELKTDEKFFCESEVISFHPDLLVISILQTLRLQSQHFN